MTTLLVRCGTHESLDVFCSLEHGAATYISLPESAGQVLPCGRLPTCTHGIGAFETVAHAISRESNQRPGRVWVDHCLLVCTSVCGWWRILVTHDQVTIAGRGLFTDESLRSAQVCQHWRQLCELSSTSQPRIAPLIRCEGTHEHHCARQMKGRRHRMA